MVRLLQIERAGLLIQGVLKRGVPAVNQNRLAGDEIRRRRGQEEHQVRHLDGLAERVRLLDPATTMARGWSITRTADGRTVRHAADLAPGDLILTTFADGTARSRVEETTS